MLSEVQLKPTWGSSFNTYCPVLYDACSFKFVAKTTDTGPGLWMDCGWFWRRYLTAHGVILTRGQRGTCTWGESQQTRHEGNFRNTSFQVRDSWGGIHMTSNIYCCLETSNRSSRENKHEIRAQRLKKGGVSTGILLVMIFTRMVIFFFLLLSLNPNQMSITQ